MINTPKIILIIVFIILIIGTPLFEIIFLKYLEQKYQKIWVDLGKPKTFSNYPPDIQKRVNEFLISKKYLELNDSNLNIIVGLMTKFNKFSNIFLILLTIIVIIAQFIK